MNVLSWNIKKNPLWNIKKKILMFFLLYKI